MTKTTALLCLGLLWGATALPLHADARDPDREEALPTLQAKNTARGQLVIDGNSYRVTPTTRLRDAWGREISLEDLPVREVSAPGEQIGGPSVSVEIRLAPGHGPPRLLELRYLPNRDH